MDREGRMSKLELLQLIDKVMTKEPGTLRVDAGSVATIREGWTGVMGRIFEDYDDLLALVRDLAESDPLIWMQEYGVHFCRYCTQTPDKHLPTCLWLRARKMAGMT